MLHLLKVGGSLMDLPDLPMRLKKLLTPLSQAGESLLLLAGGGAMADQVRLLDKRYNLGEQRGHQMAVMAMGIGAKLLLSFDARWQLVTHFDACKPIWKKRGIAVIDPVPWLKHDKNAGLSLPHRWSFTSDSIGAHIATQLQADQLTLLKSVDMPPPKAADNMLQSWADCSVVDSDFPQAAKTLVKISWINLRSS